LWLCVSKTWKISAIPFKMARMFLGLVCMIIFSQSTTGAVHGIVRDEQKAVIPGVTITVRSLDTNASRTTISDAEGRYRIPTLPIGIYEISAELAGFARYLRSGVTIAVNQIAVVDAVMRPSAVSQEVTVIEADAAPLNTSNAEVGVIFDRKRIAELPLGPDRDVFTIALSAPGVSQLGSGQNAFATGTERNSFSVNGMRVRANNFIIDGQDSNDAVVSGRQQSINNPDVVEEVRLITNQFAAEYGRSAGSVMSIVTRSGTNNLHGSAFWFHNDNTLNSRTNLDKNAGRLGAPFRVENQVGVTAGGPIIRNRTFFFGAYQRWTDRRFQSGNTLNGAPTERGRQVLQQAAATRPHVASLLRFLPAAQTPIDRTAVFALDGQNYTVPLGSLTGAATRAIDDHQFLTRIEHRLNTQHSFNARYLFSDRMDRGGGQVTPSGLTTIVPARQQALNVWLTSTLHARSINEFRAAYQRSGLTMTAEDSRSQEIPSIEIAELGLSGFASGAARTAIGLPVNLPQFRFNNTYQIQDSLSYTAGRQALKFGFDIRKVEVKSFFIPTTRGRLSYSTLQRFIDDVADTAATITRALPGGETINYYKWYDAFFFGQSEWKATNKFTLSYGLRYEAPGNSFSSLIPLNEKIVAAAGGDPRYVFAPAPKPDRNNFQPRFGFNWNPRDKLVLRGGYSRTNDYAFININWNVASAFPFIAAVTPAATPQPGGSLGVTNAFNALTTAQATGDPMQFARTTVGEDWRAPSADQMSLEVQRQLSANMVLRAAYVGTRGTSLFQTLDANARLPFTTTRIDPARGVIRSRANAASSIYHSLQLSGEKRLSRNFSAAVHYTWSAFIDDASDVFNASSGEIAVAQDFFNRRADRSRSSYDRPQRFTGNVVYELPFFRAPRGVLQNILGGWQVNSFFMFQSGAPFTVLNGSDPTGALNGIDSLVGNAIRPNLNTTLDTSSMTIEGLLAAGGRSLYSPLPAGIRTGNVGRNTLRADGIGNVDFGLFKNARIRDGQNIQLRVEMYNATNTRNFGIPEGSVNSSNFLNQWGTDGGSRRVIVALRYTF
jgi:hypothetical protein